MDRPLLVREEQTFASSNCVFGVLITRVPEESGGHLHSGVVFRRQSGMGGIGFIHVKWDNALGERWGKSGLWTTLESSDDETQDKLAIAAELADQILKAVRRRGRALPYGIGWRGSAFEYGPDGLPILSLNRGSFGLTCATLPLAILASVRIAVVKEDSWPARPVQDQELVRIAQRFGPPVLVDRFQREIAAGVRRIRPEEVIGAFCSPVHPAEFPVAERNGALMIGILDSDGAGTVATDIRVRGTQLTDVEFAANRP